MGVKLQLVDVGGTCTFTAIQADDFINGPFLLPISRECSQKNIISPCSVAYMDYLL